MNASVPLLRFEHICRSFFGIPVLRDVSFELLGGRILGLIGENGAGKSTLMNILGGVLPADSGSLLVDGDRFAPRDCREAMERGIAFVHQELNLFTNLSIAENLRIDSLPLRRIGGVPLPWIDRGRLRVSSLQLLKSVELDRDPDTLVADLSPGERQLVEIARAIGARARILILDEPTTSLTAPEAQRLFGLLRKMRQGGAGIIYISHNLEDVFALSDDIVVLRDGQVVGSGPASQYTIPKSISLMVGRSIEQVFPQRASTPCAEVALEARSLSRAEVVDDVSFKLHRGEILGISGLMGAGRTELARIIFGLDPFDSGRILVGDEEHAPAPRSSIRRGIALVTESRRDDGLLMDGDILLNTSLVSLPRFSSIAGWIRGASLEARVRDVARNTRIVANSMEQAVRTLSGGNQQKVVLSKWLLATPSIFILDEPTRGIDVGAKQEVYRLISNLATDGAAILMISSEIEELIGLCDRILVMAHGRICDSIARTDFDRERILRCALEAT